jgi:hypothetical protein
VHISSLVSRSTGIAIEDGGAPVGGPQLHQLDHMLRHGPVGVLRPAAPSAERYARRCSDDSVLKVTPSGSALSLVELMVQETGMGSDTVVSRSSEALPRVWGRKEAGQTHSSGSGRESPSRPHP